MKRKFTPVFLSIIKARSATIAVQTSQSISSLLREDLIATPITSFLQATEQVDQPTQHVSALLWETLIGTPYVPKAEFDEPPKARGRPRKHGLPEFVGVNNHVLSDEEVDTRNLKQSSIDMLIVDYKEYVTEGKTPKQALEEVSKLYRVPYGQAFNLCADEI